MTKLNQIIKESEESFERQFPIIEKPEMQDIGGAYTGISTSTGSHIDIEKEVKSFLHSHTTRLLQGVVGILAEHKKHGEMRQVLCPDGKAGCLVFHQQLTFTDKEESYNKALFDITALIEQTIKDN